MSLAAVASSGGTRASGRHSGEERGGARANRRCRKWLATTRISLLAMALALGAPTGAVAQSDAPSLLFTDPLPGWDISGDITTRYDYYDNKGEGNNSPYQFVGSQQYGELNLDFANRISPYEQIRGRFFGVANHSEYRNAIEEGGIIERFNLTWEKGDTAVPFRAEAGDYFAFLSLRTLQRSLKGFQLELQPQFGRPGQIHSLLLFAGIPDAIYRSIDLGEDIYSGASYLLSDEALGDWSLNLVLNRREADIAQDIPLRHQEVMSIAGERAFEAVEQRLTFEVELAHFRGDFTGGDDPIVNQDEAANGYFARMSGASDGPFTYSALYEQYGQEFRPNGSSVTADQTTTELRLGWRFDDGPHLRARLQRFKADFETDTPTLTRTVGLNLTGPYLVSLFPGLSGATDTFVQKARNHDGGIDTFT